MSSRLRIVCKAPPRPKAKPDDKYPVINGYVPSLHDVFVTAIDDDTGDEIALTNVTSVEWRANGDNDPATATVTFVGVDLDVEGVHAPEDSMTLRLTDKSVTAHCTRCDAELTTLIEVDAPGRKAIEAEALQQLKTHECKRTNVLARVGKAPGVDGRN